MLKSAIKFSFALLLYPQLIYAQILSSTYTNGNQRMNFNADSINYLIEQGKGIVLTFNGSGTYKIKGNKLHILPSINRNAEFDFQELKGENKDSMIVTIQPVHEVTGASVNFYQSKKFIFSCIADKRGIIKAAKKQIINADSISVKLIGFKTASLKIFPFKDYNVTLYKGINQNILKNFITSQGKGFDLKVLKDKIMINFPVKAGNIMVANWVIFIKE